jgi:hypothetical protein
LGHGGRRGRRDVGDLTIWTWIEESMNLVKPGTRDGWTSGRCDSVVAFAKRVMPRELKLLMLPWYTENTYWKHDLQAVMNLFGHDRSVRKVSQKPATVVINTVKLVPNPGMLSELMIADRLRQMGHRVIVLYDDGVLSHCDRIGIDEKDRIDFKCRDCRHVSRTIAKAIGRRMQLVPYSSLVPRAALREISTRLLQTSDHAYHGIDLDPYVRSSVVRFRQDGVFSLDGPCQWFHDISVQNAIVSVELARAVLAQYSPDSVLSIHSVYSAWGPFMKFMRDRGISTVVWGKGQTGYDTAFFAPFIHRGGRDVTRGWALRRDRPLTDAERRDLDDFTTSRFGHSSGYTKVLKQGSTGRSDLIEWVREHRAFALFPNVMWDSSLVGCDTLFEDPVEWLVETTKWFAARPELALVIRAHPAEAAQTASRRSVRELLETSLGDLDRYPNIRYVASDARISSYELFPHIVAGIVYNGTLGLELAYARKPVVLGGSAPYEVADVIPRAKSRGEYFDLLSNPERLRAGQEAAYSELLKFIYMYFLEFEMPLPFLSSEEWDKVDYRRAEEVLRNPDPVLDHICGCLVDPTRDFSKWRLASTVDSR